MRKLLLIVSIICLCSPVFVAKAQDPAKIELNPTSLTMAAKQGDKATASIAVFNRGASTLLFTISKSYAKKAQPAIMQLNGGLMVYPNFIDFGTVPNQGEVAQSVTCTAPGEKYSQRHSHTRCCMDQVFSEKY